MKALESPTNDYEMLVQEIDASITEAVHNSRWTLVEGYWNVGQLIRNFRKGNVTELLQDLALDLGKSERTLWYAVQFFDKYPKLDTVPEGKAISWNRIITKYLPDGEKEKKEGECVCPHCHYKGKTNEFKL